MPTDRRIADMTAEYLKSKFDLGLAYAAYVATGNDEQQRRWKQVHDAARLTDAQRQMLAAITRRMNVLVVSGIWCGDCVQQCPLMARIAEANADHIGLRFVDRDAQRDLSDQVKINGGYRVPTVLFLSEDFELCGLAGDRTLSRYLALARRQLGSSCPTGLEAPAPDELAATLGDWVGEFERIWLMLRLSPRLRQVHGD
jgi:thiol-disulfide isomerase/thioredoxin